MALSVTENVLKMLERTEMRLWKHIYKKKLNLT